MAQHTMLRNRTVSEIMFKYAINYEKIMTSLPTFNLWLILHFSRTHPNPIEGDNCCFCNTSALQITTSLNDVDLLYASFENNVFQTPFFIGLDHGERCIVVAIRGTMSLRDAITDLSAEAIPLNFPGIPPGCKVCSISFQASLI